MKYYTLILLLFANLCSYSQHTFGLKAGINNSSYGSFDSPGNVIVNYDGRGFMPQFGFFYSNQFSERSSFLAELQYATKGTDYDIIQGDQFSGTFTSNRGGLRLSYLEIPLSYQVKIRKSKFAFHAGLYAGILLRKDFDKTTDLYYLGLSDGNTIYDEKFKPVSFGFHLGFAYNSKYFTVGIRGSKGLATEAVFGDNYPNKYKKSGSSNIYVCVPLFRNKQY